MKLKKLINSGMLQRPISTILGSIPDKYIIYFHYYYVTKRVINLKRPKRFTEKLQWYKLNYRNDLMTICSDKYAVREYIKKKGFEDTLVELYQVVEDAEEINFETLPNSFVIKSNNGSSTNIFVEDKKNLNKKEVYNKIKRWESPNTILLGREWAYNNIPRKLIIEELLHDKSNPGGSLKDYKLLYFHGELKLIWVDTSRHTSHKRNFYDTNWNLLPVKSDRPKSNEEIPKPDGFDYMKKIGDAIAKDFPFARVDFYWVNGKVYFGEITFYPWSGSVNFEPDEFDFKLGSYWDISQTKEAQKP